MKTFFLWTTFKLVNNVSFLKASYAVLAGVPLLAAYFQTPLGTFFDGMPIAFKLGYFASLSLSVAHMIFQAFCPPIIKRFDSPNDLYRDLLEIKSMQVQWLPSDESFGFNISHCREGYKEKNHMNLIARVFTGVFYYSGLTLASGVVAHQAIRVAAS